MPLLLLSFIPPNALPLRLAPLQRQGRSSRARVRLHERVGGKGGQGRQG